MYKIPFDFSANINSTVPVASPVGALHCVNCQPVDIRSNKPFKNRLRDQWEDWMIDEGLANGTTSPPTRENIVQWTRYAVANISSEIVKNAWRHGDYSWFPPAAMEQHAANLNADDNND